ncbi:MAG: hypothetical protein H7245_07005 [Candidatus Saccharibacteria bacterium]|nr:hypothetical protein [Pseudorhodobacter sp.]
MDYAWIVPLLALVTMLAVLIFAMASKARIEERRHDPNAPKSTLAKDGPQGGVAFLVPLADRIAAQQGRGDPRLQNQASPNKPDVEPVLE